MLLRGDNSTMDPASGSYTSVARPLPLQLCQPLEEEERAACAIWLLRLLWDEAAVRCSSHKCAPHAGPFSGVAHVATLLDHTLRRPLRHALLRLLHSLMVPEAAVRGDDAAAAAGGRANGTAFMACGGVELMVDLLTCAWLLLQCVANATGRHHTMSCHEQTSIPMSKS